MCSCEDAKVRKCAVFSIFCFHFTYLRKTVFGGGSKQSQGLFDRAVVYVSQVYRIFETCNVTVRIRDKSNLLRSKHDWNSG